MKLLVLHWSTKLNRHLSYQHGWVKAFSETNEFECEFVNTADLGRFDVQRVWAAAKRADHVVILHSVFSNAKLIPALTHFILSISNTPVTYFIGNEYKHMPEKMRFCKTIGCKLLVTQSFSKEAVNLYSNALNCKVISIPGGGLDTSLFYPGDSTISRKIDLGFRAFDEPFYFGHQERRDFMKHAQLECEKRGFNYDFSMESKDRFVGSDWADFLRNCKSVIGSSSGFDHFALNDKLRKSVNSYTNSMDQVSFEDVRLKFFDDKSHGVKCRVLSGRLIEAAGTKTTLILLRDEYSRYLTPDVHYIPVNKDYSNISEAFEKLSDQDYCSQIRENCYHVAITHLTFKSHLKVLKHALSSI